MHFSERYFYCIPFPKWISEKSVQESRISYNLPSQRVDDIWFFGESNALSLGSVRVVASSQQVIFGDSKSFKTNLNAGMTKKGTLWKPIWGLMLLQSFLSVCLSWTSSCSFPWPPANFSNLKQLWACCKTLAGRNSFYTVEQGASLCSRLMWCDRVLTGLGA